MSGTRAAPRSGTMKTTTVTWAPVLGALGWLLACGASQPDAALSSQQPVPGTRAGDGVTAQQAIADEEVVERISAARCDRDQSCNRIGPGAAYRDREDCMRQTRAMVQRDINPTRCRGGVGEVGLDRCVKSLEAGQCDMPGQVAGRTAQCDVAALCMKR